MSTTTTMIRQTLGQLGFTCNQDDENFANTTQATATLVAGEICRLTTSAGANGSGIMRPILSGDASSPSFVINDSPNSVRVFCAIGEKMNGSLNGSLTIASGAFGAFFPVLNSIGASATPDWRSAAIS